MQNVIISLSGKFVECVILKFFLATRTVDFSSSILIYNISIREKLINQILCL